MGEAVKSGRNPVSKVRRLTRDGPAELASRNTNNYQARTGTGNKMLSLQYNGGSLPDFVPFEKLTLTSSLLVSGYTLKVISVSVQYDGGYLLNVILLIKCYY